MNNKGKLEKLERLIVLVNEYIPIMYNSTEEREQLFRRICELYGEVSDVFDETVGRQKIEVPGVSGGSPSIYPNFFEAGFLSGRTMHTHQGKTELLKVIGKFKASSSLAKQHHKTEQNTGKRVFLVHGRNESILQSCARFIEKLDLPLTILREQPNKGRTIIEKFVDYSDVGFAVVLLTGDDRGGPKNAEYAQQKSRARQNVLLELGFFLGRLGRERVCALYEDDVEIPSDYAGVAFVLLDKGMSWKMELAREIKAAGFNIDFNKVI